MSNLEAYVPEIILKTKWLTWIDVSLKAGEFHG